MIIEINESNLKFNEIQDFSYKVRALLTDENENILIANYGGVYLLPGGSVDKDESISNALIRELSEELGEAYNYNELNYLACLNYYQNNYPTRNGENKNRLVQTHYYVGKIKSFCEQKQELTEKEKRGNFRLELIPLKDIETIILGNVTSNPRNIYFQKELMIVLEQYKKFLVNGARVRKMENN